MSYTDTLRLFKKVINGRAAAGSWALWWGHAGARMRISDPALRVSSATWRKSTKMSGKVFSLAVVRGYVLFYYVISSAVYTKLTGRRCCDCSSKNSTLVDHMLEMVERYADNLEDIVEERTEALEHEKQKTENLLNSMLPKYVSTSLITNCEVTKYRGLNDFCSTTLNAIFSTNCKNIYC